MKTTIIWTQTLIVTRLAARNCQHSKGSIVSKKLHEKINVFGCGIIEQKVWLFQI